MNLQHPLQDAPAAGRVPGPGLLAVITTMGGRIPSAHQVVRPVIGRGGDQDPWFELFGIGYRHLVSEWHEERGAGAQGFRRPCLPHLGKEPMERLTRKRFEGWMKLVAQDFDLEGIFVMN